ncbi:MAG: FAD-binding oxidoreductase [Candidatus Electryoneaceae bacterium]|nr:FAD-binding oxidoreductase [Candidatus Electryoneaceae bacterium]
MNISDHVGSSEFRGEINRIIGNDRWIDADHPTVAPHSSDEISLLLKGYSGLVQVVGSGSGFFANATLGSDLLMISTERLNRTLSVLTANQTVAVDAGWSIRDVNDRLRDAGLTVPALIRFDTGTIGGRLASVSSKPEPKRSDGWIQSLLGLDVVLPNGDSVELGGHCIKDVAGYDMRHLFTGSWGMFGVIVRAIFRCRPKILDEPDHIEDRHYERDYIVDPEWRRFFDPLGRMCSKKC